MLLILDGVCAGRAMPHLFNDTDTEYGCCECKQIQCYGMFD